MSVFSGCGLNLLRLSWFLEQLVDDLRAREYLFDFGVLNVPLNELYLFAAQRVFTASYLGAQVVNLVALDRAMSTASGQLERK